MSEQFTDVVQVCTDGSELSQKAVDAAVELALVLKRPLVGMTSVSGRAGIGRDLSQEDDSVQQRLRFIEEQAKAAGVAYEIVAEHSQAPWMGILEVAKRYDARFIVMASRGLGSLGSLILGSETQKVLASADRPVLVIR